MVPVWAHQRHKSRVCRRRRCRHRRHGEARATRHHVFVEVCPRGLLFLHVNHEPIQGRWQLARHDVCRRRFGRVHFQATSGAVYEGNQDESDDAQWTKRSGTTKLGETGASLIPSVQ